jgi:hypothetical protein
LVADGVLDVVIRPQLFGRDPAPNVVKQVEVEYELGGDKRTFTVQEGGVVKLGTARKANWQVLGLPGGGVQLQAQDALAAEVAFASGRRETVNLPPAGAREMAGPWQVTLQSPVEAKREISLPALRSLSEHPDAKYFSGTAIYRATLSLSAAEATSKTPLILDLGDVRDLARVTINGQNLGVVWHPPFRFDISRAVKNGDNRVEIAVTNTWHNRLVGDEQFPADFEWGEDRGANGRALKAYPDWFIKNQPRPQQGRKGFAIWYYHRADTPLLPAGLLGPVRLVQPSVVQVGK